MLAFAKHLNEHGEMPSLVISVESDAIDFGVCLGHWYTILADTSLSVGKLAGHWFIESRADHPMDIHCKLHPSTTRTDT